MTIMDAAEARLAEVLNAPTQPSTGPPTGVYVKEAAVAEAASGTAKFSGEFEAIVSTWDVDRQGERFTRGAFEPALRKIRQTTARSRPCSASCPPTVGAPMSAACTTARPQRRARARARL